MSTKQERRFVTETVINSPLKRIKYLLMHRRSMPRIQFQQRQVFPGDLEWETASPAFDPRLFSGGWQFHGPKDVLSK